MPELASLCTTLRNASLKRYRHVALPYGDLYYDLLVQFYRYGYVTSVSFGTREQPYWLESQLSMAKGVDQRSEIIPRVSPFMLWVELKYVKGIPAFTELNLISKPSRPVFVMADELCEILIGRSKRFRFAIKPGATMFIKTKYGIKELSRAAQDSLNGEVLVFIG